METKPKQALETFSGNFNCAQSVLSVFAEELGLNKNIALKLATPFGAGMAYRQETCGAVTGALMAIGLKYGKDKNGTTEQKEQTYDLSGLFIAEFKKMHSTICCRELMDYHNMSTPEGMAKIQELDLFHLRCVNYVQDAVKITEKIFEKIKI
jgi:C_GCAxxG_C_C family probable redox protein